MLKKLMIITMFMSVIMCLSVIPVKADMGPKPSVHIEFEGIEDRLYYVTLLSKEQSTGPYSYSTEPIDNESFLISEEYASDDLKAWNAFREYEDDDGYYFINYFARCNEDQDFTWGYYPPSTFKILVYFLDDQSFVISDTMEKYAFNSYYTVDFDNEPLAIENSYNYTKEMTSFSIRVILTLLIEIFIAILFNLKKKHILTCIVIVNVLTQILLNVILNVTHYYYGGGLSILALYLLLEIGIIIIEAIIYKHYFNKEGISGWVAPTYSVVANVASFLIGVVILNITQIL